MTSECKKEGEIFIDKVVKITKDCGLPLDYDHYKKECLYWLEAIQNSSSSKSDVYDK